MGTISKSLKTLAVKLGWASSPDAVKGEAIAEVVANMTAMATPAVELPKIEAEDEGKLLGVVDGAYALVDAPAPAANPGQT